MTAPRRLNSLKIPPPDLQSWGPTVPQPIRFINQGVNGHTRDKGAAWGTTHPGKSRTRNHWIQVESRLVTVTLRRRLSSTRGVLLTHAPRIVRAAGAQPGSVACEAVQYVRSGFPSHAGCASTAVRFYRRLSWPGV